MFERCYFGLGVDDTIILVTTWVILSLTVTTWVILSLTQVDNYLRVVMGDKICDLYVCVYL